jgi:hypothetical protein
LHSTVKAAKELHAKGGKRVALRSEPRAGASG